MSKITDQEYLKNKQYKTSANLEARIALHRKFGTNPYGWSRWVFDQLDLQPGASVLELGCGPGGLWQENRTRLPSGLKACLSDLSAGMLEKARQASDDLPGFSFAQLDAQAIPACGGSFSQVIANHMLYHVPDVQSALNEIRRVLRPGGRLYAATNGLAHMQEIDNLVAEFLPGYQSPRAQAGRFALENAAEILDPVFSQVELHLYPENLDVTEAEPLVAYILSMWQAAEALGDRQAEFRQYVRHRLTDNGGHFLITKSQGLIVAT